MTETWEGAQWVLATYLAMQVLMFTFASPALRMHIGQWKGWPDFIGWWLSKMISISCLVAILAWGGFWTP
jgi:hypothetical protein